MRNYPRIAFTPSVQTAQVRHGTRRVAERMAGLEGDDRTLGEREVTFIEARDSFYLASKTDEGWPYIQHRGGAAGFLRVLDPETLAFADFRGNMQYISQGNIDADGRVALFLMDYEKRQRLKIFARAEVLSREDHPDLAERVRDPDYRADVEQIFVLHVEAFDWNCPQHITRRFTEAQIVPVVEKFEAQLRELEANYRELADKSRDLEAKNKELERELRILTPQCD